MIYLNKCEHYDEINKKCKLAYCEEENCFDLCGNYDVNEEKCTLPGNLSNECSEKWCVLNKKNKKIKSKYELINQ
jgi:hypothetical protein